MMHNSLTTRKTSYTPNTKHYDAWHVLALRKAAPWKNSRARSTTRSEMRTLTLGKMRDHKTIFVAKRVARNKGPQLEVPVQIIHTLGQGSTVQLGHKTLSTHRFLMFRKK